MKYFILFIVLFSSQLNSQSFQEKLKAKTIIENIAYQEAYVLDKLIFSVKINIDENLDKYEITNSLTDEKKINSIHKSIFYLRDLDLKSFQYKIDEIEPNLYSPVVTIKAKGELIEKISIIEDKDKFPQPITDTKFTNILYITTNGKTVSKDLAFKFIENVKFLFGVK